MNDYLNAMHFHAQGFRLYLLRSEESAQNKAGLDKLDKIDELLDQLRQDFKGYPDQRDDALRDVDITRKKSKK